MVLCGYSGLHSVFNETPTKQSTYLTDRSTVKVRFFLNGYDGSTTPTTITAGRVQFISPLTSEEAFSEPTSGRFYHAEYQAIAEDHRRSKDSVYHFWNSLSNMYRDLLTPSREGMTSFSSEVSLTGLSKLSDALIGRRKWTDLIIIQQRNPVLRPWDDKAHQWFQQCRAAAIRIMIETFRIVKEVEKLAFGPHSYFLRREQGLAAGAVMPPEIDSD